MTTVVLRKLEPDKRVVLKAVIYFCGEGANKITNFNALSIHNLISAEDKVKYKLSLERQIEVFNQLSEDHILDVDQIINTDFYDGPKPKFVESETKLYWKNNTEWAKKIFQINGFVPIEQVYAKYKSAIFINLSIEEANRLYNSYIADHMVHLKLDTDRSRLYIRIDDGEWKGLPTMHEGSLSYGMIKLAWKDAGHKVSLKQLEGLEGYNIYNDDEEKYISSIYERNSTVKALHPKLLLLGDHYMIFKKVAKYTYDDLCDLRAALKI